MKLLIARIAVVLISVLAFALPADAVRVTPEQAMRAARNWLRRGYGFERRMGTDIEAVRSLVGTNGAAFHIAAVKGGGFVVLGSDTQDGPVVAVSAQGSGEPDGRSPLWALLRQDMAARMLARAERRRALQAASGTRVAAGSSPEERWAKLLEREDDDESSQARRRLLSESDGRTTIADVRVDALLQSAWSQTDYRNYGFTTDDDICYNYYTPNHWPCGCVATAGAQVMRYHSYPTSAVVAGTYACKSGGSSVSLTMCGGTYDWGAMTLVPASGCSATSREAIGRLTYDVGVSVGMFYGSGGSSAADYMLSKRFVDRFQYANAVSVVFQDGFFRDGDCPYTLERFKSAVIPNFDEGLPVVLGISGRGGHAVVGDGYGYSDGDFFVHINLGWANMDNGNVWYMPPNIDSYTSIDSIVYNVYPTGASGASLVSGRILSTEDLPVEGASVRAVADGVSVSVAASSARGIYALRVSPGQYWVVAEKDGQSVSNRVAVSACVSPHIDDSGNYWNDVCPQIGNVCDNDLTLGVEGTPDPPPPPPQENLTWYTTKAEAFSAAEAAGRRILLVYGRDTCGNTTATRNYTCEDAEVKAKLLAGYVLWYSDCDTQLSESGKYLVNFDGYLPGVTVIDPGLDKGIVGTSGYLDVAGMLELLEAAENWEPPEPPGNDDFADAAELTGVSGSVTAMNEGAMPESGEPLLRNYSSATTTVWWKWTAPSAGSAVFNTVGSAFDTVMGVYTGSSLQFLTTIAQDDDGGGGRVSECTFDCTASTTYYVCIGGYNASSGNISLQWSLTAADPQLPVDGTYTQTVDGVEWVYTIEGGVAILGYNIGRTPGAAALRTDTTGCVTIPASFEGCPLQVIGPTAFEGCAGITEIVIPESVRRIDWYAFNGCKSLQRIVLPPNLDSIGSGVFHYCEHLQGIEIPASVTQISSLAFGACTNFQDFVVLAGNENYVTRDGILFASDEETLVAFPGGRQDVVFPQGVVKLGDYSFYGGAARRVSIPKSVRELGTTVFMNSQLEEIDFGAALRKIPESTCEWCCSLVNVTLRDGLVEIGEWAFNCCSALTTVAIPSSVDKIGEDAFRYCRALSRIDFAGAPPADVAEDAFTNVLAGCVGTYRVEHAEAWTRVVDGNGMWKGLKMERAGDPPAPEPTTHTVTFVLGELGVRTGGGELTQAVEEECAAVEPTFDVSPGWSFLGWSCDFSEVTSDLTVYATYGEDPWMPPVDTLPDDGTYTQTVAGVEWVYTIEDGVAILGYNPNDNFTPGPAAISVSTFGKVVVPDAFEGCPLEKIGSDAFHGCANLTEIVMPDSVTEIGRYAFMGCCKLAKVELPPHLVRIKWDAFGECESLTTVEIPASVSWIDSNPFLKCTGLQDIVIHADNANYASKDGILLSKDGTTLIAFPGGRQDVSIPQGVTKLGYESFYGVATSRVVVPATIREMGTWVFGYSQIEEIEFDAAVSAVPAYACISCSDLVKVVLHDGLGEIGESAFSSCSSLTTVAIPASVDKIGEAAFLYCRALSRVDFAGAPPADVAEDAFTNVLAGCVGTYQAEHAEAWTRVVDGNGMWKGLKMECAGDPPAPEEQPVVYEDLDQAKAAAIREGKLVFLLSGANWCPYTAQLKQYVTDAGSLFTDNYVYLWHDQDQDAFGIAATSSIPEFWIFLPSDLNLATKTSWDTIALYVCRGCPSQYDSFLQILESFAETRPALESLPLSVVGAGWHEVSFPVLPEGGDPADVFASVEDKVGYVTSGSKNWNPLTGGTLLALEIGKGYWVQTTAENVSWTVTGQSNPGVEISLKPGWNLIGYPLLAEGNVETVLATALATGKIDYIYSGSRVYPGTLATMMPGKGYWVYANAAVTIKFDF